MTRYSFFALLFSGRSVALALDALHFRLIQMETTMADNQSVLMAKLEQLEAKVDAYTTDQGNKIAAAVAAAKAAQQKEDKAAAEAEMADALAKIEEIGNGLVTFNPSGN